MRRVKKTFLGVAVTCLAVVMGFMGTGQAAAYTSAIDSGITVQASDRRACNGYVALSTWGSKSGTAKLWTTDPNNGNRWGVRATAWKPAGKRVNFGYTSSAGRKTVLAHFAVEGVRTNFGPNTTVMSRNFNIGPC